MGYVEPSESTGTDGRMCLKQGPLKPKNVIIMHIMYRTTIQLKIEHKWSDNSAATKHHVHQWEKEIVVISIILIHHFLFYLAPEGSHAAPSGRRKRGMQLWQLQTSRLATATPR